MTQINDDLIAATTELAARAGATRFEIGHNGGDEADMGAVRWHAVVHYQGGRIMVDDQPSPSAACLALGERLLSGATCKCRRPVTLSDGQQGCRWRLAGPRWEPGCDAPPLRAQGGRGDVAAMRRALDDAPS